MRTTAIHTLNTPYFDRLESYGLLYGYVVSTPTAYVLAMPAHTSLPPHIILDIANQTWRMTQPPNMIHVWIAAGNLRDLLGFISALPCGITHLSYERLDHKLRIIPIQTLLRHGLKTKITSSSAATCHGHQQRRPLRGG